MTYTTEERIEIERLRFESKAGVLRAINDVRAAYVVDTKGAQTRMSAQIKDIRTNAKDKLVAAITEYLDSVWGVGLDDIDPADDGGDDNE